MKGLLVNVLINIRVLFMFLRDVLLLKSNPFFLFPGFQQELFRSAIWDAGYIRVVSAYIIFSICLTLPPKGQQVGWGKCCLREVD